MHNIIIIGSSSNAKVMIDIIEKEGKYRIAGVLDRFQQTGNPILGYNIIGKDEDLPRLMDEHDIIGGLIAIGDNYLRNKVFIKITEICPNFIFINAIHPSANIARNVSIGEGTVIMAGVTINPDCSIGSFCILNTNSSLDHESSMQDFSSIAPNVCTGGKVTIGEFSFVGIGTTVIDGVMIGKHSVIGAGSTVLKSVESYKIVYGSPAKEIRNRCREEKYL